MRVGRALVCIVARRNRSHTLIARVYKPDIPPKCTEMVWLGILNTQIQFKKIRQFSSSYGDEICLASIRWPARKVAGESTNGAKRKPIRENPNIFYPPKHLIVYFHMNPFLKENFNLANNCRSWSNYWIHKWPINNSEIICDPRLFVKSRKMLEIALAVSWRGRLTAWKTF